MNDYLDRVEARADRADRADRKGCAPAPAGAAGRSRRSAAGARAGGGGPRPPRRRDEALAFLAAAAVVAAVVAIVLVNAHHSTPGHANAASAAPGASHSTTTSTSMRASTQTNKSTTTAHGTPSGPTSTPIPAHFSPQSFTAISELTWWVLGPSPCQFAGGHPPCGSILRTTDGGRHFVGVGAPHATLSSDPNHPVLTGSGSPTETGTGFAFGPDLYATHDGGQSWHSVTSAARSWTWRSRTAWPTRSSTCRAPAPPAAA